jgi:hypothetical protein
VKSIVIVATALVSFATARSASADEPADQPAGPTSSLSMSQTTAPPAAPAPSPEPAPPRSAPADAPAPAGSAPADQPQTALPRESAIENPLGRAPAIVGSAFGGYGELTLNVPSEGTAVVDMRRLVFYFGHDFTEKIRFYSELEIEHAISSSEDEGEVEVEQAYLDGLLHKRLNLRGGLLLMPVGIINVYHEPPSFNGVDRPDVDQLIIPSTWREPGFGIFGELAEGLRYQLYLVNGFNANGFTAEEAIRGGHQEAQLAYAGDVAAVGRIDYEPVLGTVVGASVYGGTSGNSLRDTIGRVPIGLFEADARTRRGAFTARAELAFVFVGDADKLSTALLSGDPDQMGAGPISSQSRGGYLEVGYDVMHLLAPSSEHSVTAFGRFDYANTQASVPAGFNALPEFRRTSGVFGLVWRPIAQIAIKGDYRHRSFGAGPSVDELAAAITWLF